MTKKRLTSPIILAVLCAVGVHTVLFTDAGHRMQGAITEASTEVSDSHLILHTDTIGLVIEKDIPKVTQLSASLIYNTESMTLSEAKSSLGTIAQKIEDYSDEITIVLSSPKDIKKGTTVATWKITKSLPEIHTINLSEVQVQSGEDNISLSTRGTGEF